MVKPKKDLVKKKRTFEVVGADLRKAILNKTSEPENHAKVAAFAAEYLVCEPPEDILRGVAYILSHTYKHTAAFSAFLSASKKLLKKESPQKPTG